MKGKLHTADPVSLAYLMGPITFKMPIVIRFKGKGKGAGGFPSQAL